MTFLAILVGNKGQLVTPAFPWKPGKKKCHSWLSWLFLAIQELCQSSPFFHESQVVLICGKVTPGFLGFSWQNSNLKLQPFHEFKSGNFSFGKCHSWLSWLFLASQQSVTPASLWMTGHFWSFLAFLAFLSLLFLRWSNSRLSFKAKSYLLALQAFLGIPLQAFQESQECPCFSAFSRLLRGKKAWKSQESREGEGRRGNACPQTPRF